jgi:hypothetical protein
MRTLALVTLWAVSCGPSSPPCDTAPFLRCESGTVYEGGCGGESVAAQCAKGCAMEGQYTSLSACPLTLCRENAAKLVGDACVDGSDCTPTKAVSSSTAVTNLYLKCDLGSHTCVATDGPQVLDWLKPCSASVIAQVRATNDTTGGYEGSDPDPGCAEGRCAVAHEIGASCIANACTRPCDSDDQCPSGSTCNAEPLGCGASSMGYCEPGGPFRIGFSCH